jgi:hypothetical protein
MATKPQSGATGSTPSPATTATNPAARRPTTSDVRDALAELAERAQIISQEAGTKVATAIRDVIGNAAGVAGFALESARDLVQYLVRRGQMTAEEGERLIREAEAAHAKRSGKRGAGPASAKHAAAPKAGKSDAGRAPKPTVKHASHKPATKKPKAKAKKR